MELTLDGLLIISLNLALDFLEIEKDFLHLNLLLPSRVLPQTTVYLDPQLIHAKR
ncbi:hypothetical protein H6764_03330 [Candidatus Nomurabacteria bacterium]|nr:hypothetical protein [Candidatus Nomurabacteria bacterium]